MSKVSSGVTTDGTATCQTVWRCRRMRDQATNGIRIARIAKVELIIIVKIVIAPDNVARWRLIFQYCVTAIIIRPLKSMLTREIITGAGAW